MPEQVQVANPLLILTLMPLFNYLIYPAIHRIFPLTPLRKIGIGLFLTFGVIFSHLVDTSPDRWRRSRPGVAWQFLAYVLLTEVR